MSSGKEVDVDGEKYIISNDDVAEVESLLKEVQNIDFRKPMPKTPGCGHSDEDICDCDCHNPDSKDIIRHMVACCYTCPNCKRRIKYKW